MVHHTYVLAFKGLCGYLGVLSYTREAHRSSPVEAWDCMLHQHGARTASKGAPTGDLVVNTCTGCGVGVQGCSCQAEVAHTMLLTVAVHCEEPMPRSNELASENKYGFEPVCSNAMLFS